MVILHSPPDIQWEVTTECNHDCIHCYNYWRKDSEKIANSSKAKTMEEYLRIANQIINLKPVSVVLTGGEPLLVFDKIEYAIRFLQRNNICVSINTNATLLTEEICSCLRERDVHLFVSFPCANPEICDTITNGKNSLAKIVAGLDLAKEYGVAFSCNIVVSTKNIDYVESTVDFLMERYHPRYVSITRVGRPINSDDSFNKLMLYKDGIHKLLDIVVALSEKYPNLSIGTACPYTPCSINSQEAFDLYGYKRVCAAGKTSFALDVDGNFKACPRDSHLYGNILEQEFDVIYESMHEWRDGSFIPEECKSCRELSRCLCGCRVDSLPFTGRLDVLDCISDPANLPMKYEEQKKEYDFGDTVFTYDWRDSLCLKDGPIYRLSHGRNYVMITSELYMFLVENSRGFTSKELAKTFNKSTDITNAVIGRLASKKIIFPKKGGWWYDVGLLC